MKRWSRLLTFAIVFIGVAYSSLPSRARADDGGNDIPGSLWRGPSVTSSAGGQIVDRVWRLELAEGRVAMLRLVGERGSELGLYLFDRNTQSVLTDDPLKTSALPGGTQSIVASLPAGTYFVNVNGRNTDRPHAFSLSIGLFPDPTPPELNPRVVSGSTRVSGATIDIDPGGYDGLSGIADVRFRIAGDPWSDWIADTKQLPVPIPASEGPCVIEIEARNGVGLVSSVAQLTVVVDRTPPRATPVGKIVSGVSTVPLPLIKYRFSEPMRKASIGSAFIVSDFTGARIEGNVRYDPAALTATFVPKLPLELGRSYAVDFVGATDIARNIVSGFGGWSFTYLLPTSIRTSLNVTSAKSGASIGLRGFTTEIPSGSRTTIEWRATGSVDWIPRGTALVRNGVTYSSIVVSSSGAYRLAYPGDATHAPARSQAVEISVRPALQLVGAGSYVRKRGAGAQVTLRGFSEPQGLPLVFARYRCDSTFTRCTRSGGETVSADLDGRATSTWVATKGYWGFRLKTAATAEYAAASTALLKFYVP